jgi:hypothetical protein
MRIKISMAAQLHILAKMWADGCVDDALAHQVIIGGEETHTVPKNYY